MTTATAIRSRTLAGFVLTVLGAFATARASPSEVITVVREWESSHGDRLALRAPPLRAVGPKSPVAILRMRPVSSATDGFYEGYLARRVSALFGNEQEVAAQDFANPGSRPWTGDPATVQRVQKLGVRAIGGALKRYAVERLGIDRWSFPATGRSEGAAVANDSPRLRFHLGFSHLAPRADLRIPVTVGRVVVSADARGRIGTTFEPASSRLRVAADVDVRERTATVALSTRF